jgi:hypothetical protein
MNIQEIDFQPLFQWINKCLGTNADFQMSFEGKRPKIVNVDNIWENAGIFQSVINEVNVDFFNFNFDEETETLWATVSLSYESWSGGSNGMQIGTCCFNPTEGWTFESCKERFEKYNR